ncbi:MAG: tyrosine-type recombinase/integrase [Steroidobacteraceae bacterium]
MQRREPAVSKLTPTAPVPSFPALVQAFFAQHLTQQRALSPRTVATYRDAFVLFLDFVQAHCAKSPTAISLTDLTPELILAFLDHLERKRHNTVRTRNARLAALRSFLKFAAHRDLSALHVIERALGVPAKRFERPMLGFLSNPQMRAIIGVRVADIVLHGAACVHLHGKGRKQRSIPLWRSIANETRAWLKHNPRLTAHCALLPNRDGEPMTRSNVTQRLTLAVRAATKHHPELATRRISPHTIRHSTAMRLLQSREHPDVIALWLGHESPNTTHHYVEADLSMKTRSLARLQDPKAKIRRYRAPAALLEYLKGL